MPVQSPALVTGRPSANHRVNLPAFAIADAVQEAAVRCTLATGLAAIAVIHALDSVGKWSETRYMFWLYMALIAGSVVVGGRVLFTRSRAALAAATGLAAAALAGYVVSRSVGLPGAMDDIGNWTEPLGLASIVVEGLVVAVGLAALARPARLTAR